MKKLVLLSSIGKIFEDGKIAISKFSGHLENIREKVAVFHPQRHSPEDIRNTIFGKESQLCDLTGGHYSILNLVNKLLAGMHSHA